MPRFHFDLVDARTGAEEEDDAQVCDDETQAKAVADQIAKRLAASEPTFLAGYCVLVTDVNGVEVYRGALRPYCQAPNE